MKRFTKYLYGLLIGLMLALGMSSCAIYDYGPPGPPRPPRGPGYHKPGPPPRPVPPRPAPRPMPPGPRR